MDSLNRILKRSQNLKAEPAESDDDTKKLLKVCCQYYRSPYNLFQYIKKQQSLEAQWSKNQNEDKLNKLLQKLDRVQKCNERMVDAENMLPHTSFSGTKIDGSHTSKQLNTNIFAGLILHSLSWMIS